MIPSHSLGRSGVVLLHGGQADPVCLDRKVLCVIFAAFRLELCSHDTRVDIVYRAEDLQESKADLTAFVPFGDSCSVQRELELSTAQ